MKKFLLLTSVISLIAVLTFVLSQNSATQNSGKQATAQQQQPKSTSTSTPAPHQHSATCGCKSHTVSTSVAKTSPSNPLNVTNKETPFPSAPLISLRTLKVGSTFTTKAFGQTLSGKVILNHTTPSGEWMLNLRLDNAQNAVLSLRSEQRYGLTGDIQNDTGSVAYQITSTHNQQSLFVEHTDIQSLICGTAPSVGIAGTHAIQDDTLDIQKEDDQPSTQEEDEAPATPAVSLTRQSRPGAPNVIYLDFDGETVENTSWNTRTNPETQQPTPTLVATPSSLYTKRSTSVDFIWRGVSEDFETFNINVTTDRAVYDAAATSNRVKAVFTDYSSWYGSASGVAYRHSFGGMNSVCWVFTSSNASTKFKANTASHELGHTLGLSHDGNTTKAYHTGHLGDATYTSWRPIMGTLTRRLVTWDNGSYPNANQTQNDLSIMVNKVGAILDENTGTAALPINADGTVLTEGSFRLSANNLPEESDSYSFSTAGGPITLNIRHYPKASPSSPTSSDREYQSNLDLQLEILNSEDEVIFTDLGEGKRDASYSGNLAAGSYTARIKTTAAPAPTYYSKYGQLGIYSIQGSIPQDEILVASPSEVQASAAQFSSALIDTPVSITLNGLDAATFSATTTDPWITPVIADNNITDGSGSLVIQINPKLIPNGSSTITGSVVIASEQATSTTTIPVSFSKIPTESTQPISIPAAETTKGISSPYPATINVPQVNGSITSVKVVLNGLSHDYPSDIRMLLVSPTGKKVVLLDRNGSYSPINESSLTFSTTGAQLPSPLTTGEFQPNGPAPLSSNFTDPAPASPYSDTMEAFVGESPSGTWELFVMDTATGDTGSLTSWGLHISTNTDETLVTTNFAKPSADANTITFTTIPGQTYIVESSTDLTNWNKEQEITATGAETTTTISKPSSTQQFFHIKKK